jgi:asparagine synthase (glutamine-hydrolysing)
MTFLGSFGTDLSSQAGPASAGPVGVGFQCIASHRLNGQSLTVWGKTPFIFADGQGILLSGKIFNTANLASRIGAGSVDGLKLLLHAYRKWGAEFPKHLEGEFAFVLWDGNARRLLIGRDPTGYRPLFYTQHDQEIRFSGHIRTLLAWPGIQVRPDERHVAHWLALIPSETNSTFFENISLLPPGHTLLFENGRTVLSAYCQPEKTPLLHLKDSREYADGLREVLKAAIKDRLRPGAIAGSQMSGGLDSSSVTALAAGLLQPQGCRLFAFTAVPEYPVTDAPGKFNDEGPHAASVVAMYPNMDHVLVRHGCHPTFSMIDRFSSAQLEPILNPTNYDWMYEICLQARSRGVETLLKAPAGNLTISYRGALALPSLLLRGQFLKAAQLAQDIHRGGNFRWRGVIYQSLGPFLPAWARNSVDRLRGVHTAIHEFSMIRRDFAAAHGLDSMTVDGRATLKDSRLFRLFHLRRMDLGSFAEPFRQLSGVSMTDPTMDPRVIEYCFSVPLEYFCERGVPRSLIRNAMAGLLPEQVRTERRRGLQGADFGIHFQAERQEALDELARMKKVDLAARALNLPVLESMMYWSEARIAEYGQPNYWGKLMRAFSLGRFLRRLEDGTLFSPQEAPPILHNVTTSVV